jgi:hypothetical protein
MIVNLKGVPHPIHILSDNLSFLRIIDDQTKYVIDGNKFLPLINSQNTQYILVPSATLKFKTPTAWDEFLSEIGYPVTKTPVWYVVGKNSRVQCLTLFGFRALEDAVMFKLTWL